MKRFSILLVAVLTISFTTAFSLPNFWYSAVAYNAAGQVITTGPLAQVDVTITDGTNSDSQTFFGVPVDAFGIFNVYITGAGSVNMVAGTQITVKVNGVTVAGAPLTSIIYNGYHFGDYIDLDSEVAGILPDANVADDLTIDGGTINNTVIGGTTPANGTFYDLTVTNDLDVQHYLFSSTSSVRITDDLTVYQTILQNATAGTNTFNANTLFQGDVNIGSSFFDRNLFVEYGKTELNNGASGEPITLRVNANGAQSNAIVAVSSNAIDNDYATIYADKSAGGEGATAWFTGDDTDGGSILFVTNDASATPSINSHVAEIQSINSNAALLVANASGPAVKIVDGTEGAGKILTSDASGNASWQDQNSQSVGIVMQTLTANIIVPNNTETLINNWASILSEDGGSNYNPLTGEYTIPISGTYLINASIAWEPAAASVGRVALRAFRNGVFTQDAGNPVSSTGRMTSQLSFARKLLAGDLIKFYISQSSGANMTVTNNLGAQTFSIQFLHK
jgi:hypothetical protein